jgi:hypothetical protein
MVHGNTKLTAAIVDDVVKLVRAGAYVTRVVDAIQIDRSTLTRWMQRGANLPARSPSLYRVLYDAVRKAEADLQHEAVTAWKEHWKRDYRAIRDFLARRFPEEWGARKQVDVSAGVAITAVDVTQMIKETWDAHHRLLACKPAEVLMPIPGPRCRCSPRSPHDGVDSDDHG